jgi:hypothetical protein
MWPTIDATEVCSGEIRELDREKAGQRIPISAGASRAADHMRQNGTRSGVWRPPCFGCFPIRSAEQHRETGGDPGGCRNPDRPRLGPAADPADGQHALWRQSHGPYDANIRPAVVISGRSPFQLAPGAPHPTDRSHRGAEV